MKHLFLLFLLFVTYQLHAQTGEVKGNVSSNGKPLSHISVSLDKTRGAKTDNKGDFHIKNLTPGAYNITFSAIGYQKQTHQITVRPNELTVVNATLIETGSNLNEVIITGVSRATELRKNPIPVAVITKKQMDQYANSNVIDAIVKGVPGVNAVTTGPNISKPFIRGLGYNRVLTLYDGIRQEGQQWGDEHGIEVDQFGITRAEVVKGPASLTYGSDALAGVINMLPYLPDSPEGRLTGDATTNYQSNNGLFAASAGLYYQKNDWKYNFRATGKIAHNYQNKIDGPVYNTALQEYNLGGIAELKKNWGTAKFGATLYNNKQEIPDGSRDSLTRKFTRQILDAGDDIKNRPLVPSGILKSYNLTPLHQHIQHYRLYNQNQFNIGEGSINTMLALQQSVRREYNHPTQPSQAGLYVVLNTLNYDFKYNFPAIKSFETTFGVNGMYQTNRSKQATDFPIPDYNLFDAGAFFFAKKSVNKIDISGGIRYDNRHIRWNDHYIGPNPVNGFEKRVYLPDTAGARLQFPAFSHNYTGLSGSLGLTYNISERLLIKANIARGYRAPNITEIGSNGLDPGAHIVYLGNRNFNPEFSLQQDVGFMAYLKDLDISLELFNNNINNYIYQARLNDANGNPVVIVPGNSTYQYQQSKARLYGTELTVNLHPQHLNWLAFNNSLSAITGLNKNKTLVKSSGGQAKYLPFIPPLHWRSQLKFTQQNNKGHFIKSFFSIEADVYAAQNRFYALDATETYTPGYTLVNLGLGTTIQSKTGKKKCDLILNVDNLFDIAYQSNLNRLKYFEYYRASPNGRLGIYNMGRNMSIKIIVPF